MEEERYIWHNDTNLCKIYTSALFFQLLLSSTAMVQILQHRTTPAQQRWGQTSSNPTANIIKETRFDGKEAAFLSIEWNKQQLLTITVKQLTEIRYTVCQAEGDGDVGIGKTAVNSAILHSTPVLGESTDLVMLVLHYNMEDGKMFVF